MSTYILALNVSSFTDARDALVEKSGVSLCKRPTAEGLRLLSATPSANSAIHSIFFEDGL